MELDKIKLRLKSLGYEVVEGDELALNFVMSKVEQHIKHYCNIDVVPECLEYVFIDMVAGEFLQSKKSTGQLSALQIEPIVKKIQDGDTTVEFSATADMDTMFNQLTDKLIHGYEQDLLRHRKLVW